MRLLDHCAQILVGYLVIASITAGAWAIVVTRAKARRPVVNRATYPLPVPPVLPRDYDPQPPVWTLSGDALDERMREALGDDAEWLLNLLDGEAA